MEVKVVEEVFSRTGRILALHIGGEVIETTAEHPFYVHGAGWKSAGELAPGDLLRTLEDGWQAVQEVNDTEVYETVYNLRVSEYHTYFVGCQEWGFSVWAHNADYYVTPKGTAITAPAGYEAVPAMNGKGLVLLPKGQGLGDNRNIIRYSDPVPGSSTGTIRYYNGVGNGQPLNPATGQPGTQAQTHIPENHVGELLGYPK